MPCKTAAANTSFTTSACGRDYGASGLTYTRNATKKQGAPLSRPEE